ncbi:acyl-CoA thioesterase [soil metagenome]
MNAPAPVPTSASRIRLSRIMDALDTNLHGNVHGGVIMKMVDDAAGACAARHSGGRAVTASMDEMVFLVTVHVGDIVTCYAQVNWTGRTSMEIGVRVTAQPWDVAGVPELHVASAYLAFVGVDEEERPRPTPPLLPETDHDKRRWQEAEIRRTARLARRDAIQASRTSAD